MSISSSSSLFTINKSWTSMLSLVVSLVGSYCFYSFFKSKNEERDSEEHYDNRFRVYNKSKDEYELKELSSLHPHAVAATTTPIEREQIASHYNNSEKLKRSSVSFNRIILKKNTRQDDLNALIHLVRTKLESYPPLLRRELHLINSGYAESTVSTKHFRVMQWNGLANSSCIQTRFGHPLPKELEDWSGFRKWRMLEEIAAHDPDVITLQEADFYKDVSLHLSLLGYSSVFCPKYSPHALEREPDGCAVFWRDDVFIQIQLCCDTIRSNGNQSQQVYIITQLRHKKTGKRVNIMCVHLKAFAEFAERRVEQTDAILAKLQQVWSTPDERRHPLIICGDFNGESHEPFYELMVKRNQFRDAYEHHTMKLRATAGGDRGRRKLIDYIFYTSNVKQMSYLDLKASNRLTKFLPNIQYPSDHLSLVCDFQFS